MQFVLMFAIGLLLINMGSNANPGSILAVFIACDKLVESQ